MDGEEDRDRLEFEADMLRERRRGGIAELDVVLGCGLTSAGWSSVKLLVVESTVRCVLYGRSKPAVAVFWKGDAGSSV